MALPTASNRVSTIVGIMATSFAITTLPCYAASPNNNKPFVDTQAHIGALPGGNLQTKDGRCVSATGTLVNCGMPGFALFVAQQIAPGEYTFQATTNQNLCLTGGDNVIQPCDGSPAQQWLATKPAGGDPGQPPWGLKSVGVQDDSECLVIKGNYVGTGPATDNDGFTCPPQWK